MTDSVLALGPKPARTMIDMPTVAQAADRIGRNPETIRRWTRSGRLRSRRMGQRHAIEDRDLRTIEATRVPEPSLRGKSGP